MIDKKRPSFENESFRAYFRFNEAEDCDKTGIIIETEKSKFELINFNVIRERDTNRPIFAWKIKDNENGNGQHILYFIPEDAPKRSYEMLEELKKKGYDLLNALDTLKSAELETDALLGRMALDGASTGGGKI